MDYSLPRRLRSLADEVREFVDEATVDTGRFDDSWVMARSREFDRRLAARGWLGMTWPREYGGGERSDLERFVVLETLLTAGAPVTGAWFPDRQIGPVLLQYGTEAQKQRWLPEISRGESAWCIGMSEPDAGSDVAHISTTARRDGDRYIVDGQKIWTSGAHEADWCYLICRTDPDAPAHKGLSELIVDMDSPGIEVRPIRDATGGRHFNEVFFSEVSVPVENLVGRPNHSFGQTMRQLEHERGGIDRLISNRRLHLDVNAVADSTDPLIRDEMAALETEYTIGRHMVLRNVTRQAPPGYSAVTKIFCTEHEQRVASFASRVLGPAALRGPDPVSLPGRVSLNTVFAPAYTIMGGTGLILRNIVGERVLGLPREPRPPR
ncbi:MAG TPA: acyl-CoA dehydrogenase [Acidimicrobiales bacterium]|nr:acyl-CoA dehydrogenase [Acidimicrobiales bacterium]